MSKYLLTFLFILPQLVQAQQNIIYPDSLSGKILYSQKLIFGNTTIRAIDTLKFNQTKSIFRWQRLLHNNNGKKEIIKKNSGKKIIKGYSTDNLGQIILYNVAKDSMYSRAYVVDREYLLKAKTPNIIWNITDSTKKIGKFKSIMATTHFRGRDYTVWFTTEIPVPYGPWKLVGLPGLILQAHDKQHEITFNVKKMMFGNISSIGPVPLNGNEKVIHLAQYKEMMSNYKKIKKLNALRKTRKSIKNPFDKNTAIKIKVTVPKLMEIFSDSTNNQK